MSLSNNALQSFENLVSRVIDSETHFLQDRRERVLDTSTLNPGSLSKEFRIKLNKKKDLEDLLIISFYLPEDLGFSIRESLRERSKRFSLEDQVLFSLFCDPDYQKIQRRKTTSELLSEVSMKSFFQMDPDDPKQYKEEEVPVYLGKTNLRIWLLEQNLFGDHDFFGNRMTKKRISLLIHSIKIFDPNSQKVKKQEFKRGYQDHGSQRPKDKWTPKHDFSFDQKHQELQARKTSFEDTVAFLRGYLGVREDSPH